MNDWLTSLREFAGAWDLFRDAVWANLLVGLMLGWLGVYVLLRRIVFLSAAVTQAASLGVVLAFWLGTVTSLVLPPMLVAAVCTTLAVLLLTRNAGHAAPSDWRLGVVYLLGSAATLVLASKVPQEIHDIDALLFGSGVAVMHDDYTSVIGLAAVILPWQVWWWRGISGASFDPRGARVRGLPVPLLEITLMLHLSLVIALSTRVVGALPTFALGLLPAMTVLSLSQSLFRALVASSLVGGAVAAGGYVAAYVWNAPVGASQTLVGLIVLALGRLVALLRTRN